MNTSMTKSQAGRLDDQMVTYAPRSTRCKYMSSTEINTCDFFLEFLSYDERTYIYIWFGHLGSREIVGG